MKQTIHSRLRDIVAQAHSAVLRLTPRQRAAALRELEKLTETNCWWALYQMREPIREFIKVAQPRRQAPSRAPAKSRKGAA